MSRKVNLLYKIFLQAASNVPEIYFDVPIAGTSNTIYREQVYCYELYHQIRLLLTDSAIIKLFGEIDKGGHPLIASTKFKRYKPDFIFHRPNKMNQNLIAVETKTVDARKSSVISSAEQFVNFVKDGAYKLGIFYVYGNRKKIPEKFNIAFTQHMKNQSTDFVLLWQKHHGEEPKVFDHSK